MAVRNGETTSIEFKQPFIVKMKDKNGNIGIILTDSSQKESIALYGTGENGDFDNIENMLITSLEDKNRWANIKLSDNNMPKEVEFSDGKKVHFSDYENGKVSITINDNGNTYEPIYQSTGLDKLKESAKFLKKYEKSKSFLSEHCKPDSMQRSPIKPEDIDNLIRGAFFLWDAVGCLSGMAAIASGVGTIAGAALTGWSCGSVLMGLGEEINKNFSDPPLSPVYFEFSDVDSSLHTAVSCGEALIKKKGSSVADCAVGVAGHIYNAYKKSKSAIPECKKCCYKLAAFCETTEYNYTGIAPDGSCMCLVDDKESATGCISNPCGEFEVWKCAASSWWCMERGKEWCDK